MTEPTQKTALIVGATGTFGAHAAAALAKHGWRIRALARNPVAAAQAAGPRTPIEWVKGDAMKAESVVAAAQGAQLIVHAANPPRYRNWKGTVLPMAESAIAAAKASGARLVIPGNVYNFASNLGPAIREDAPQTPVTRKGKIRVEMERRLRAASQSGAKVLVLRSGDFFGPAAPNSALGWLTTRKKDRLTGVYVATRGPVGHAFAYMPDLAETLARLADAEDRLGDFEVFHFRGHWATAREFGEAIRRASGQPKLPIRGFPWLLVELAAPFNETFRELLEMRYLWRQPIGLDNTKLVGFLGEEPATPLDRALRATLADMGVLDEPAYAEAGAARASSAMAPTM